MRRAVTLGESEQQVEMASIVAATRRNHSRATISSTINVEPFFLSFIDWVAVSHGAGILRGKVSELKIVEEHAVASETQVAEFLSDFLKTDAYTDNTPQPIVHQLQQIRNHLLVKQKEPLDEKKK